MSKRQVKRLRFLNELIPAYQAQIEQTHRLIEILPKTEKSLTEVLKERERLCKTLAKDSKTGKKVDKIKRLRAQLAQLQREVKRD